MSYQFSPIRAKQMLFDKKEFKHDFKNNFKLLPFTTRKPERATFTRGIEPILGFYFRYYMSGSIEFDVIKKGKASIKEEDFTPSSSKDNLSFLRSFLNDYFSNDAENRVPDATFFAAELPSDKENEAKGEREIAHFLLDIFPLSEQVIEQLKLNQQMPLINRITGSVIKQQPDRIFGYYNLFPDLSEAFREDSQRLVQNSKLFVNYFPILMAHYYNAYCSQAIRLICSQDVAAVDRDNSAFYYVFVSEKVNKSRSAVLLGYSLLHKFLPTHLYYMNRLDHLNYTDGDKRLYFPHEILNEHQEAPEGYLNFLSIYCDKNGVTNEEDREGYNFFDLLELHIEYLKKGMYDTSIAGRYSKNIYGVGNRYFHKRAGRLGTVLKIDTEMILALVACCVTEKEMLAEDFFTALLRRKIALDDLSKMAILEELDRLNLLIKRSDSFRNQYIKSLY